MARCKSSHRVLKDSAGKIVNNIIISLYGARWVLDLIG